MATSWNKTRQPKGSIAVLAVFCLIIAATFLAFSVDWGYITVAESELQNAADSGALSGARALHKSREAAIAAAQLWAGKNTSSGSPVQTVPEEDVEIGVWDDESATFRAIAESSDETPNAVRVTCRRTTARGNALSLFFAPLIGINTASLTATAVAATERDDCGFVVGLDKADLGNGTVEGYDSRSGHSNPSSGNNIDVCSDGPIELGPVGKVRGDAHPGKGFKVNRPRNISGTTTPRKKPIRWKPANVSGVERNNSNDAIPQEMLNNGRLELSGNQVLTLAPGTYYFPAGVKLSGLAQIELTGPTRFVMGGHSQISGTVLINTSQSPSDLRIDITDGSTTFTGNSRVYADIFGPHAHLAVSGNAEIYGAVFGKTLTMNGAAARILPDKALKRKLNDSNFRSTLKE